MSDHISRAREYIAKGEEYYAKAADEIIAAQKEDPSLGYREIGARLGKSKDWVGDIVRWRTSVEDHRQATPYAGQYEERMDRAARTALKDPEQRKQVIASLPPEQIEEVIAIAQDVAVERVRAQRAEHDVTPKPPTAGDLMGGDKFDPAEYWADTLVIRVNRNARGLSKLVERAGGLLFGTMPPEEAFDYLHEAERLIAEVRAAAQEQVRDQTELQR